MSQEEDLNPSSRYTHKKMRKPTQEEELEEKVKIWGQMYEKMREERDAQQVGFGRMQTLMFYFAIILLIIGLLVGIFLGRAIFG